MQYPIRVVNVYTFFNCVLSLRKKYIIHIRVYTYVNNIFFISRLVNKVFKAFARYRAAQDMYPKCGWE